MKSLLFALGHGIRNGLVALGALALLGTAIAIGASYSLTQGSGTNFASLVISSLNYAAGLTCDPTAGITQCAAVDASNRLATAVANGANVAQGTTTDVACTLPASGTACTLVAIGKATANAVNSPIPAGTNTIGIVRAGTAYQEVAASSTATVLQTSTGATGDYLSHCIIYPATTGAGNVTVFDNTNSAANNVIQFVSGTLSNLVPFAIPVGTVSVNGPWKVTTGANVAVVCVGKFS